MKVGEKMTNPFIFALCMTVFMIAILFIGVSWNKKNVEKRKQNAPKKPMKHQTPKTTCEDVYHVGGITTEHFILILMETNALFYGGYSYEVLTNKRTQTNFDAFSLYDDLFDIFNVFDEILDLDYVNNGYGSMNTNGVEATYDAQNDLMRIKTLKMTLEGSYSDLKAFRNNPIANTHVLDMRTASHQIGDYTGDIEDIPQNV